ncbi:MAG: sugar transferase [Pseudonocardia sp.]|nr:sugar transferase [Pseudonocardia sp.]
MRRSFDIVVSLIVGLILTPVALAVALAVRVSMGSPVLFHQERSGRDGRPFTIVKFRTMPPEAFPGQDERERRTRTGELLRATGLDEIPQLWNILRGDMSVIGPRPTLPEQIEVYTPRQRGRLAIRPGLTGWAQVNGRNSIDWPERIELDLWYIENRSLGVDLRILVRTAARLLRPDGVYGADGLNPDPPGMMPGPVAPARPVDPGHPSAPAA